MTSFSPAIRFMSSVLARMPTGRWKSSAETTRPERVIIIGGGNVGLAAAKALEASPQRVRTKIIERNRQRRTRCG